MNKLKTCAAILKFINGSNNSPNSLRNICEYTTDAAKTNERKLMATHGCSHEHPVEDMIANKRLHNKTHGKQYEHFVLAPCPNGSDKSPEDVLKVTQEIVATVYPEFMAVISAHNDSKVPHSHTVIDTVNAVTGRKFSQSPSDLNRVKQKANSILKKHGFEIITASANEFVDYTDYSDEDGFDFLEIEEEQFEFEDTTFEISSDIDDIDISEEAEDFSLWHKVSIYNYGGNAMNNMVTQNLPVNTTTVEAVPSTVTNDMVPQTQQTTVPASTVETVPATVATAGNSYPNTNVVTGPTFRIKGTPDSNFEGLNELVEQTSTFAQKHMNDAANLAISMNQYCQKTGYPSNVSIYAGPIFDIDMTGGMYPPLPDDEGYNT